MAWQKGKHAVRDRMAQTTGKAKAVGVSTEEYAKSKTGGLAAALSLAGHGDRTAAAVPRKRPTRLLGQNLLNLSR